MLKFKICFMKPKVLLSMLVMAAVILLNQCTYPEFDSFSDEEQLDKLPESSKQFGLSVAKELNATIRNLHKQGVDYSDANETAEFRKSFYNDFFEASPSAVTTRASVSTMNIGPEEFVRRVNSLTKIQLNFIDRIIKECSASTSETDYYYRLMAINNDIHETVPEIQQERLFNVISVLYYGMKEIQKLECQGMMISTPRSNVKYSLIKTRSEPGGDSGSGTGGSGGSGTGGGSSGGTGGSGGTGSSFGDNCRKFLATTWAIAIGEPTPAGEIVAAIATVMVAGVLLYEVVVCSKRASSDRDYCEEKYKDCMEDNRYSGSNSAGWGKSLCAVCLETCKQSGVWNCN